MSVPVTIPPAIQPFWSAFAASPGSDASHRFYATECVRLGREFNAGMPVVCENFEVIHRNPEHEA